MDPPRCEAPGGGPERGVLRSGRGPAPVAHEVQVRSTPDARHVRRRTRCRRGATRAPPRTSMCSTSCRGGSPPTRRAARPAPPRGGGRPPPKASLGRRAMAEPRVVHHRDRALEHRGRRLSASQRSATSRSSSTAISSSAPAFRARAVSTTAESSARFRSWIRRSALRVRQTSRRSAMTSASPGQASASATVSPTPTPQLPWRPRPRAISRRRFAAWWKGVTTRARSLTVTRERGSGTPARVRCDASTPSAVGWTTTSGPRWVRTPGTNAPAPIWAKVWCRPSGVTTLWPAWAPPLKRTTSVAPSERVSQSVTRPLPASPKPRSTTMAARGSLSEGPA